MEVFLGEWDGIVLMDSGDGTGVGGVIQDDAPRMDVRTEKFEAVLVGLVVELLLVHAHTFGGEPLPELRKQ